MEGHDGLAVEFEGHRTRLRAVAYRMLGSAAEAEDAVQETWLRLDRADAGELRNLGGWLTTVVSRICLDMLRAREARREDPAGDEIATRRRDPDERVDPEQEAVLLDSVGRALLVVLDRLEPDERVAFVLHDMFAVPFAEIAPIVERTPATAKKVASRARGRVRGTPAVDRATLARHRGVVEAFLAASRAGDLEAILAVLAPDVVRTADPAALPAGRTVRAQGAEPVAEEIAVFGRAARFAEPALVDGRVGAVVAPKGRLRLVIAVTVEGDRVAGYEMVAAPERLRGLELAVLDA